VLELAMERELDAEGAEGGGLSDGRELDAEGGYIPSRWAIAS
jgi:hypothetical protein